MKSFIYNSFSSRVVFGEGSSLKINQYLYELNCKKAIIISGQTQASRAKSIFKYLDNNSVEFYDNATMHSPIEITEEALKLTSKNNSDCIISFGGGSSIGLSKAIALRTGLPQIAVPTTYSGSEVTSILGQTEKGVKTTIKDTNILPNFVIYDPHLTLSLPTKFSVTSGLNAIAHAAEGLYAKDANPITNFMSIEGMKSLAESLPKIIKDPKNLDSRSEALFGAWLCGSVLGNVGMSLHHKLCHVLGGSFETPHAETHSIMLPHTIGFNSISESEKLLPINRIFGDTPGRGLYNFCKSLNAPLALKDLGITENDLEKASDIAMLNTYWNPRKFDRKLIREIFQDAYEGACPSQ